MKSIIIVLIAVMAFFLIAGVLVSHAASIDRTEIVGSFVVNIMRDGEPVKEIDGQVVVPFNSEYELYLKNDNDRRAVAKVTIDGANISSHGDIVIPAKGEIRLERFITESLDQGKRFKFVPLDHPEVDDPSRKENGLIRVVFQLEEKREFISWPSNYLILLDTQADSDISISQFTSGANSSNIVSSGDIIVSYDSSAQPGATIGGSKSDQKFHKVDIDLEDETWVVELRMRGWK